MHRLRKASSSASRPWLVVAATAIGDRRACELLGESTCHRRIRRRQLLSNAHSLHSIARMAWSKLVLVIILHASPYPHDRLHAASPPWAASSMQRRSSSVHASPCRGGDVDAGSAEPYLEISADFALNVGRGIQKASHIDSRVGYRISVYPERRSDIVRLPRVFSFSKEVGRRQQQHG